MKTSINFVNRAQTPFYEGVRMFALRLPWMIHRICDRSRFLTEEQLREIGFSGRLEAFFQPGSPSFKRVRLALERASRMSVFVYTEKREVRNEIGDFAGWSDDALVKVIFYGAASLSVLITLEIKMNHNGDFVFGVELH